MKRLLLLFFALLCLTGTAKAATPELSFDELYSGGGVLGLQFSDKVKKLAGQRITIRGFMAPPLKAEAAIFVLEIGSHRDGDTGFISQLRLRDARFRKL